MSILSPALLGAAGLVLLAAAAGHLRSPADLRRGLAAHQVLPTSLHRAVATVLGPVELVLGALALAAAVGAGGAGRGFALGVSMPLAALFLLLTAYLVQVLRTTRGQVVPCACGLGQTPVGPPTIARAGILTAVAVLGGVTAQGWSLPSAPATEASVALAAMLVLALATALLPAARAVPEAVLSHAGGHR